MHRRAERTHTLTHSHNAQNKQFHQVPHLMLRPDSPQQHLAEAQSVIKATFS